jgi:putative transposase
MKDRTTPTQYWVTKGATVTNGGREYVILNLADVNLVLARDIETGNKVLLKMGDIGPPTLVAEKPAAKTVEPELLDVTEFDWAIAQKRREWIEPLLLSRYQRSNALYDEIAAEAQVSRATVYRWVTAYRATGTLSSLLPMYRNRGGKAKPRIAPEVEAIIAKTLAEFHDTDQHVSIAATIKEIRRLCSNAELKLPAVNTIRARLNQTNGPERTLLRYGAAVAHAKHQPIKGVIPDADWPLSIVQIDHTLLPVMIVDDKRCVQPGVCWHVPFIGSAISNVCRHVHQPRDSSQGRVVAPKGHCQRGLEHVGCHGHSSHGQRPRVSG